MAGAVGTARRGVTSRAGAGHSQSRADTPYTKLGFWRLVGYGAFCGIALVVLLTILGLTLFEIVVITLLVILVWGLFLSTEIHRLGPFAPFIQRRGICGRGITAEQLRARNAPVLWVFVIAALFEVCCGSGSSSPAPTSPSTPSPAPPPTVTSVSITGPAPAVGATAQYTATATLSNGTTQNASSQSTWQSSNTVVATVSSTGVVTGAGLGIADLRATYQGVTGFTQVNVATVAPGKLAISTTATQGWTSIDVLINGQPVGTLKRYLEAGPPYSCDSIPDARVVATVQAGTVTYAARSDRGTTWSGTQQVGPNGCFEVQLLCDNRNCAPPPAAPAPPAPTPPPPAPSPSPTAGFYVWGGLNYAQYLGFFTCLFCTEFAADSINNQFGPYGNPFSSTSIRNQFGTYGNPFSPSSVCGQFASNPPRVYNSNRTLYYGELTLNQFRPDAIKTTTIVNWLATDVCRH